MAKHNLKRFILFTLLISLFTYSTSPIVAQNIYNVDKEKIISNSYTSIMNINKQLASILQNYFINLVDETNPKPSGTALATYSNQLNNIKKDLDEAITLGLEVSQRSNVEILFNAIDSLSFIIDKTTTLLNISDPYEQYVLFRSITFRDTLLAQILSYFK